MSHPLAEIPCYACGLHW